MDFEKAIKRPFLDMKSWIIGCALNLVPIVNFFSVGYTIEAAKLTLKNKNTLPEWKNWGDLFMQGLFTTLISLIYLVPALICFLIVGITVVKTLLPIIGFGTMGPTMMRQILPRIGTGIFFFSIGAVLALAAIYLLPAAVLGYASTNKFGEAFNFSKVLQKAFRGKYALAFLVTALIHIVLGLILGWVWFIGPAIAGFTGLLIGNTLFAEAYK